MRRVFKTRNFARWTRKAGLSDAALCAAVAEMEAGLIDADLGKGLLKKRIALPGRGKRGSTRTLVATNKADRWFYVFGFEKNERSTLKLDELKALQANAADLLGLAVKMLAVLVKAGALEEICHD